MSVFVKRMCRYLKNELIHKGALVPWGMPNDFKDAAVPDSDSNIFSTQQHERFDTELLLTGAWFLECSQNAVHKDEAHLVPPPRPGADGAIQLEVEDDDDAFADEPAAPVVQPKRSRGVRRRRNEREAPAPSENAGRGETEGTQASQRTQSSAPSLTQGSQGGVGNADLTQAFQGTGLAADRRGGSSTQASQGALTQVGSQPTSSIAEYNTGQSPLRLGRSKPVSRPIPVPKPAATSSSSPELPTLPMYLAKGNIVDLIRVSTLKKRLEPQLVDIVEHIKKVS